MNKIVFIVFVSLLLSSCTVGFVTSFKKVDELRGIDFRKYSKEGFLFTPEKYNSEYESVGIVSYTAIGSAKYRSLTDDEEQFAATNKLDTRKSFVMKKGQITYLYYDEFKGVRWVQEVTNVQDAVDSLYVKAKKNGADAIINFNANEDYEYFNYPQVRMPLVRIKYKLTGFAIKRK